MPHAESPHYRLSTMTLFFTYDISSRRHYYCRDDDCAAYRHWSIALHGLALDARAEYDAREWLGRQPRIFAILLPHTLGTRGAPRRFIAADAADCRLGISRKAHITRKFALLREYQHDFSLFTRISRRRFCADTPRTRLYRATAFTKFLDVLAYHSFLSSPSTHKYLY